MTKYQVREGGRFLSNNGWFIAAAAIVTAVSFIQSDSFAAPHPRLRQIQINPNSTTPRLIDAAGHLYSWNGDPFLDARLNYFDHVSERDDAIGIRERIIQTTPWPLFQSTGRGPWMRVSGNSLAMGEDRELYEWGREGLDNSFSFSGAFPDLLEFQRVEKPEGVGAWADFSADVPIKAAIGDDGELYVWGPQRDELFEAGSLDSEEYGRGLRRVRRPAGVGRWTKVLVIGHLRFGAPAGDCQHVFTRRVMALADDGRLYQWGYEFEKEPSGSCEGIPYSRIQVQNLKIEPPAGVGEWTDFALGHQYVLATGSDGVLYGWGLNNSGQLGVGLRESDVVTEPVAIAFPANVSRWTAFAAGGLSALAMGDDGNVYWWGIVATNPDENADLNLISAADRERELSHDRRFVWRPVAVQLPTEMRPWKEVHAGFGCFVTVGGEGTAFQWGWNNRGDSIVPIPGNHREPPANFAPFARMRSPLGDKPVPDPTPLTLKAEVIDVDGALSRVEFFVDGQPAGEARRYTNDFYHLDVPPLPHGRHSIFVRAVDDRGAVTDSAPATLRVQSRVWLSEVTDRALTEPASPAESSEPIEIRLRREGGIDAMLMVQFQVSGSARWAEDYRVLGPIVEDLADPDLKRVVFPAHVDEITLRVEALFDDLIEDHQSFAFRWAPPPASDYRFDGWWSAPGFTISEGYWPPSNPPDVQVISPEGSLRVATAQPVQFKIRARADHAYIRRIEVRENGSINWSTNYVSRLQEVHVDTAVGFWGPGAGAFTVAVTDSAGRTTTTDPVGVEVVSHPYVTPLQLASQLVTENGAEHDNQRILFFVLRPPDLPSLPLTIRLAFGGTATPGQDYVALPEEVTIPADQNWIQLPIITLRDPCTEPAETITIAAISNPCLEAGLFDPTRCYVAWSGPVELTVLDLPVIPSSPPVGSNEPPRLSLGGDLASMGKRLELVGTPGARMWLEASTDLASWVALRELVNQSGRYQFLDWSAQMAPVRFYRLKVESSSPQ